MDDLEPVAWHRGVGAITLFDDDLAEARRFYAGDFELPLRYEDENSVVFHVGSIMLDLLDVSAVGDLVRLAAAGGPTREPARNSLWRWRTSTRCALRS